MMLDRSLAFMLYNLKNKQVTLEGKKQKKESQQISVSSRVTSRYESQEGEVPKALLGMMGLLS